MRFVNGAYEVQHAPEEKTELYLKNLSVFQDAIVIVWPWS